LSKQNNTTMKTINFSLTFLLSCFISLSTFAQDIITVKHSCSFDGSELNEDFYTFDASNEAEKIVAKIVAAVSLQKNFIVKSSDCKNALATTDNGKRYILYNTSFLEKFKKDARTKWAAYCVMAHEIGHHLNGHDFKVTDKRKRKSMELEADIFAGGVLYTLGASLEEAKAGIDLLQSNGESDTHPPARARAEAIASGWKKKEELQQGRQSDTFVPSEESSTHRSEETTRREQPEEVDDFKPIPAPQKKEPMTTVSDQVLANNLVGFWTTSFYNNLGQPTVSNVGLFPDYSMRVEIYVNGIHTNTAIEVWGVQNGDFIETELNGIYYRFSLQFINNDKINITFKETNGIAAVPIGHVFTYSRFQP